MPRNLSASIQNNQLLLKWNSPIKKSTSFLGYNVFLENSSEALNTTPIKDTTYLTSLPGQNFTYSYKVIAKYQHGESEAVTCTFFNSNSPQGKDSLALVAIYNQCNGKNWTRKSNWLTGALKTWEGARVENGRVIRLYLRDLVGNIPSETSNLTEIRVMDLSHNHLTGTLPETWTSLINLEELGLENNQFSGTLPVSWSSLIKLKYLLLDQNQLTGTLPLSWSSLINIKSLYVDRNQLSGTLPTSWSSLINLEHLYLSSNQLSGTLPTSWSTLVNLKILSLGNNQLSGSLPLSWSSLINLEDLYLDCNQLSGMLPSSWSSSLINLKNIYISQNGITNIPELNLLEKLETLVVDRNQLDFGAIEPNIGIPRKIFSYNYQSLVGRPDSIFKKQGEQCTISVNVSGKSNKYQWFKNGGIIIGATQTEYVISSVTSSDAGTYTCHITNSVATELTLQNHPITLQILKPVANAGTISGISTICPGQNSVVYSISTITNATSYIWTLPTGATGTSTTNIITVNYGSSAMSGNITVKGSNSCGDGVASTLAIIVNPKPTTPIATVNANILHSNASTGNQWYNQNVLINGATNQDYTFTAIGNYSVIVSINGCASDPSATNVVTGVDPNELNASIKVYPNPVAEELSIEFVGNTVKTEFVIVNSNGQIVFNGNLFEKVVIPTNNYSPGLYFIKLKTGKTIEFKKIVKL